jgi:hypothetical protein
MADTGNKPGPANEEERERKEFERRRRTRNWALLAVLAGLVILFYILSIVRLSIE